MQLIVNGQQVDVNVDTLRQLVEHFKLKEQHVVAEVDGEIVDRSEWSTFSLKQGNKIELVHFVGGG